MATRLRTIESLTGVDAGSWNRLLARDPAANDYPFLRHEFLSALETTGCVGPATGWQPRHVLLERDGVLTGVAPVYRKEHSYGEFVFDFAWAQAYRQIGLAYYPKLVCAVPFSPVQGPRLLAVDEHTRHSLAQRLTALADDANSSSLHVLFANARDHGVMSEHGALLRRDCQYQWFNRGYGDFDSFLATLSSKRRKAIRRERRRLQDADIHLRVLAPADVDAELAATLYAFYARTYHVRGQHPYLTPAFFDVLGATMPEQVRYFVAFHGSQPLAMAFTLRGRDTLYGRHWGCAMDIDGLHFETCYYAGIDYCIRHGLARFDAGAQGEHKLHRGFEPVATYSAHLIGDARLRAAVTDFLRREGAMMASFHAQQRANCAFPEAADNAP